MNTILYINPLTPEITFLIFDWDQIVTKTLTKNLDTASTFPRLLVAIVDEYQIDTIWCVTGPGPFTLMRVVTLTINAISYTRRLSIKSCHFFDLITSGNQAIIEANPREYLIRSGGEVINIAKALLPAGSYEGIFTEIDSTGDTKYIQYSEDRANIYQVFSAKPPETRISPLYFKPPHITCPQP